MQNRAQVVKDLDLHSARAKPLDDTVGQAEAPPGIDHQPNFESGAGPSDQSVGNGLAGRVGGENVGLHPHARFGGPNIVDLIKTAKVNLVINTPLGRESFYDEKSIRRAAIRYNIPCITTLSAATAAAKGIRAMAMAGQAVDVSALQDLHRRKNAAAATRDSISTSTSAAPNPAS